MQSNRISMFHVGDMSKTRRERGSPIRIGLSPESSLLKAFQRKILGQWSVTMLLKVVCVGTC